jgi:deoxyribodipyrimidine photo-lyase
MRVLFWFRGDLRLADNTGLHEAARDAAGEVVPFHVREPAATPESARATRVADGAVPRPAGDDEARSMPGDTSPARARFVDESLADLARAVERAGSRLVLADGPAVETVPRAARLARADAVYWNDEYEPALERRDDAVERALVAAGVRVRRFHDRLLVPPGAVATRDGRPFVVYSPFRRACEAFPPAAPSPAVTRFAPHDLPGRVRAEAAEPAAGTGPGAAEAPGRPPAAAGSRAPGTSRERMPGGAAEAEKRLASFVAQRLPRYAAERDLLAGDAGSRLSADLAAGTLSARAVAAAALRAARATPADGGLAASAAKFVSELRWRDFYAHVLRHFPHCEGGAFRREYDALPWPGDLAHLAAWREGRTGYPVVDAAMRELATTGFMHNRARMIVASFLTKDLLLDWRLGERHFRRHLVDWDLASNNGGWQWAASTGTDPQPYFRIFNPVLQGARFDPDGTYVRRWVPELARVPAGWIHRPWETGAAALAAAGVRLGETYPERVVDHDEQRGEALRLYGSVRGSGRA